MKGLVYNQGLNLILVECAKLYKAKEQFGDTLPLCNCVSKASMGIPCYHTVAKRLANPGYILPEDIHPFWWYKRPEPSTVSAIEVQTRRVVLNPAMVRGKGGLRGAKGKKSKNNGITATHRDPSQFEYMALSSLALARLSSSASNQPSRLSIAVSSLIQSSQADNQSEESEDEYVDTDELIDPQLKELTTTQLGIQRLQGIPDTYQPGTLPPRLYQSNPFAVQTELVETGENEYQITA